MEKYVTTVEQGIELEKLDFVNQYNCMWVKDPNYGNEDRYELVYTSRYNWSDYPCYSEYEFKVPAYTFEELAEFTDWLTPVINIECVGRVSAIDLANEIIKSNHQRKLK